LTRRAFYHSTYGLLLRRREGPSYLGVAMIDLDNFKRLNDTHGHSTGDKALVAVAGALRLVCPPTTMIARFGGEEFVVADIYRTDDLHDIAEQFRKAIAAPATPSRPASASPAPRWARASTPPSVNSSTIWSMSPTRPCTPPNAPAETRAAPATSRTPPSKVAPLKVVADVAPVDVVQVCHLDENSANVYVEAPLKSAAAAHASSEEGKSRDECCCRPVGAAQWYRLCAV
jgi:GGDEF domain-containing protein